MEILNNQVNICPIITGILNSCLRKLILGTHLRTLDWSTLHEIRFVQREERTVGEIYHQVAAAIDDPQIRTMLTGIAREELEHYKFWAKYTGHDIAPDRLKVLVSSVLYGCWALLSR